ncbi:unnamed protein product [Cercospora beticola]|nr:unnamed protein product [Cercospora beticola]
MVDFGSWGDLALRTFVNVSPSPQWANRQIEPFLGLPFGTYLRSPPPTRPRRLTAPLDSSQDSIWQRLQVLAYMEAEQRCSEQEQSGFLSKLPYDVRVIIYEMVLGGQVFHCYAQNAKSRITHYVCNRPEQIEEEGSQHKCSDAFYDQRPSVTRRSAMSGLLAPLLTCRKMYSEAVPILYGSNTFVFSQNFAAFGLLKLKLPQQRLPCFRRFRLHMRIPRHPDLNNRANRDWADLWRFFGTDMTGLQSLYLEIQMLQPTEAQIEETPDDQASSWLKPVVVMAVEAQRARGCQVEIEIRGVKHRPAQIYGEVAGTFPDAAEAVIMERSCAAFHQRIRTSLG